MLDAIIGQDPLDAETWDINGGWTTRQQLNDMEFEAYEELVRWMAPLPLYAVVETDERRTCWCMPASRPRRRGRFCLNTGLIVPMVRGRWMPIANC